MKIEAEILSKMEKYVDPEKKVKLPRFFKTGPGEYGEGDKFLGVTVTNLRKLMRDYKNLSLADLEPLITNEYHEFRMFAVIILIHQFEKKTNVSRRDELYDFYMNHLKWINNWDLVDISAPKILGQYILNQDTQILTELANSGNLWKERIAILATLTFIRNRRFNETLELAHKFLHHPHDLIHKAVGWMLREVGNRHKPTEIKFLNQFYSEMPRTMLRYAIEKFPETERQAYLKGTI